MVQEALATAQMIVKSTALLEYLMQFVQLGPIPALIQGNLQQDSPKGGMLQKPKLAYQKINICDRILENLPCWHKTIFRAK